MLTTIGGRVYRRVSLDSDPLAERDREAVLLDKLMRGHPTPASERTFVRTRNGNLVLRVAR